MSARGFLTLVLLVSLAPGAWAAKKNKSASSTSEGPDLDAAARREIQCPKGFVPEKTGGPHLVVADKPQQKAKGKKKKGADDDAKNGGKARTMSRRCVPAESLSKPTADDSTKEHRMTAEAIRD